MFVESVRAKLDEIFSKAESKGDTFIFDNEFLDLTEMLRDHIEKQSFKLYRFSKADYDNIRNFETGTLYLSPNGAMNDIFEGIPNEDLSDLTDDEREYLKETVFLKSFSENKENQLMWAHYADFSQGMCVEYDLSLLDPNNPVLDWVFPVRYSDRRYLKAHIKYTAETLKQMKIARLVDDTLDDSELIWLKDIMALFLTKGNDWSYESEWRILIPRLVMYDDAIVPPLFPNRTIPFDCATAVYCGFNMSNRIMQHLTEIAKRKSDQLGRQITVTHVELDTEKYKLKL